MLAVASPPPAHCYATIRAVFPSNYKLLHVVRDGDYAVVQYDEPEMRDEDLVQRRHGRWCLAGHGKGGPLPLLAWGVPPDVARRLSAKLQRLAP